MMKTIDARGLSCPEPVLRSQDALKTLPAEESLEVLVETVTSRENVSRMARARGYQVASEPAQDGFRLVISRS